MSERPSQKLKLSMAKGSKSEPKHSPPIPPPSASKPTTGPPLKLKFGKKTTPTVSAGQATNQSTPSTPSIQPPTTTKPKPARKPKPTPKKRALEEDPLTSSNDEEPFASTTNPGPAKKKIKITIGGAHNPTPPPSATGRKPQLIRVRTPRGLPIRPRGVGYDSEASDRELDPMISECLILRMAPGPDCDYLRTAVAAGNFGGTKNGGADVRFRFLRSDGRRACVTIRGNHYAAILVDLPCVIEAMKSWFPKTMGWMKSADICQMLMVLGKITHEEEALDYPLPTGVKGEFDEKTWQWAHGLTPPMHWVRKRRFRKRISVRTVMEVEAEVEEMLRLDALCEGDPIIEDIYERPNRGSDLGSDDAFDGDEDAEGDYIDEQQDQSVQTPLDTIEAVEDEEAAHARMAEEYEREMMLAHTSSDPAAPPSFASPAEATPPTPITPSAPQSPSPALSPSSSSSSEEDDNEEEELDEAQTERLHELQKLKEEVRDLDELVRAEQGKLAATGNQLLKRRIVEKIKGLTQDRELKLAAAGMGGE